MQEILLSIYIPTHNRCKLVMKQLNFFVNEFVKLQEKQNLIEIVVSDNCSDDYTYEVVDKYIKNSAIKNNVFKIYKNNKNVGIVGNVYESIEKTCGKYLWIVSDDDKLVPGVLRKIMQILENRVGAIYLNTVYKYQIRDFTYNEIRYNGNECILEKPKKYMLENFWQRVTRMGLSTSLIFDRKYLEILSEIIPLNMKEAYGWGICIPMIVASQDNIYFTKDIWVELVSTSTSWEDIMLEALTGSALSLLKLDKWYTNEEIKLMFKVYEENAKIVKGINENISNSLIKNDPDYFRCYEMAIKCNPLYTHLDMKFN